MTRQAAQAAQPATAFDRLPPFRPDGTLNVVVETPAGCRCKLRYDTKLAAFTVASFLPEGFAFPFDFGFVPGTRAADGDPLDILLLAEAGTTPGCVVPARLIGALSADQQKGDALVRDDRLLAVPLASREFATLRRLKEVPSALREQIEHFLSSYGMLDGKNLRITGLHGPKTATKLLRQALEKH